MTGKERILRVLNKKVMDIYCIVTTLFQKQLSMKHYSIFTKKAFELGTY